MRLRALAGWVPVSELRLMLALSGLSLATLVAGWALETVSGFGPASLALFLIAYAAGGAFPVRDALRATLARRVDVNLLMVAAAVGAAALGFWQEGATLMFLFALSATLETYALARTRRAVEALMTLRPETARVVTAGGERDVPIGELGPGDVIIVRPGDRIPLDGLVLAGASAIDESTITGESLPVDKAPGDRVYAATLNHHGVLRVRATAAASESTLARIVRLVEEAQAARPRVQRIAERIGPTYTLAVFALALLTLVVTRTVFGFEWGDAIYRAMVVMVVASPCAVMIPLPATVLSAIANGALRGIVFKGGDRVEAAGRVTVVAFDKTGTLTRDEPAVTDVVALNGATRQEVLRLAFAAEQHSEHPLAAGVLRAARAAGLEPVEVQDFAAVPGLGVQVRLAGRRVWVGKPALGPAPSHGDWAESVDRLQAAGRSTLLVGHEDAGVVGVIALADQVRVEAPAAIAELRTLGVHTVMLTGDNPRVAATVAGHVGVDEFRAGLMPADKARVVRELAGRHGPVAMVGDGVNDAPSLAAADLGIAMGIAGSAVALEAGDVVLTGDELARIPQALVLGRRANAILRQNIIWAVGIISALLLAALTGGLSLTLAVVGHEGSTLLGVLNGLRLLRGPRAGPAAGALAARPAA